MRKYLVSVIALIAMQTMVNGQQDLQNEVKVQAKTVYANDIFKTTRVVIGHSVLNPPQGNLLFLITHHFGALNTGYENLFGLKQAYIRLGLEMGLTRNLGFGLGLNSNKNTWDGFLKYRVLRQSSGLRKMPLSLTLVASSAIYTTKWENPDRTNYFYSRISYAFEAMVGRKFGKWVSFQIMPVLVHRNLVPTKEDHNDVFTLGAGGRVRISNKVTVNAEYHYLFPDQVVSADAFSSFSVGVDIEAGGHVFQIFLTNSMGENEQSFLTETTGKWSNGEIFLGFNINRLFTVFYPKE